MDAIFRSGEHTGASKLKAELDVKDRGSDGGCLVNWLYQTNHLELSLYPWSECTGSQQEEAAYLPTVLLAYLPVVQSWDLFVIIINSEKCCSGSNYLVSD